MKGLFFFEDSLSFFFLLKFLKKRPKGTFDIISRFIDSEKSGIKVQVNTSLSFITAWGWDNGERRRYKFIFIFTKMGRRP